MRTIKYGAFTLLSLSSAYLSINMFSSLGADLFARILLIVIAISLESVKVFSLLRIEYFLYEGTKLFKSIHSGGLRASLFIYTLLALLSVLASFGFTLVTVDRQVEVARIDFTISTTEVDFEVEQKRRSLEIIEEQIASLQDQMRRINPDFATGATRLSLEARVLDERRNELVADITALLRQQSQTTREINLSEQTNVYGMFYLMGRPVGLDERQVMFILLVLISILIEVGMIYTSPTIPLKEDEVHEVTKVKASTLPKKPPTKKKREPSKKQSKIAAVKQPAKGTIQLAQPKITTEQRKIEKKQPTEEKILQKKEVEKPVRLAPPKLLQIKQGQILKSPADIAYTTNIPVDVLNAVFRKLSLMRPRNGNGTPLIQEQGSDWKMNYSLEYIMSLPAVQEVLRGVEVK